MTRTCRELELLIGRPATILEAPERLVLEQHLAECADCRRGHALARSITQLVSTSQPELRDAGRERALTGALARIGQRKLSTRPPSRTGWLALGLAAAALLALGLPLAWPEAPAAPLAVHTPSAAPRPTPAASAVAEPPVTAAPELDQNGWIEATAAQQRRFGHAQVAMAAGTRVRFDPAARTLELASGRVDVDVETQPGETFVVSTHSFRVQVLGTQFAVTPDRVEVTRGHVQVLDPTGKPLVRDLRAGKTFEARGSHTLPAARSTQRASEQTASEQTAPEQKESGAALLVQARAALARSDVTSARELVQRAQQRTLARAEQAEAGTLSAECALLERQPEQAVRAYLAVADHYRELAAGENALFAAAQLRARDGDPAAAALLERYLARYPQGRFADEAKARLRKLQH